MKRQGKEGEFRSNLTQRRNLLVSLNLAEEESKLALKAARKLKLPICGVDILQSNRGPLVMEINSTPGLEGIEGASGKNILQKQSLLLISERNRRYRMIGVFIFSTKI